MEAEWGAAATTYKRILPQDYPDGPWISIINFYQDYPDGPKFLSRLSLWFKNFYQVPMIQNFYHKFLWRLSRWSKNFNLDYMDYLDYPNGLNLPPPSVEHKVEHILCKTIPMVPKFLSSLYWPYWLSWWSRSSVEHKFLSWLNTKSEGKSIYIFFIRGGRTSGMVILRGRGWRSQ